MGRKLALIIGNSQYEDAGLSRLPATQVDIRELAEVLEVRFLRPHEQGQLNVVWQCVIGEPSGPHQRALYDRLRIPASRHEAEMTSAIHTHH